jgi:RNA polymerase subunit RPABC4/transcription elongation factor Spt4
VKRRAPVVIAGLLMAILALAAIPSAGIIIGTVIIDGQVTDKDGTPLEGTFVVVVGMDEYNATTDENGSYNMVAPFLEVGHVLRFTHNSLVPREISTGPLEADDWVTVNATMSQAPPRATLHIILLPWNPLGSNYGLRQDEITVINASGTPSFEWSDSESEYDVIVPAPGTYQVIGTRPGYYPARVMVDVVRGDRIDVDVDFTGLKKPTYGVVNGTVEHRTVPLANATIVAEPDDDEVTRTYQAVTDSDGHFSLDLPKGNFSIRVRMDGYSKLSQGVEVDVGKDYELYFPMSVAQETGSQSNSYVSLLVAAVIVAVLAVIVVMALRTQRSNAADEAEKAARKDELRCPSCDAVAPKDTDSCAECGTTFPWKSFRCPDCGAVMELDATRCPECGNQTFDLHRG